MGETGKLIELELNDARHEGKILEIDEYIRQEIRPALKVVAGLPLLATIMKSLAIITVPSLLGLFTWMVITTFEYDKNNAVLLEKIEQQNMKIETLMRTVEDLEDTVKELEGNIKTSVVNASKANYRGIARKMDSKD